MNLVGRAARPNPNASVGKVVNNNCFAVASKVFWLLGGGLWAFFGSLKEKRPYFYTSYLPGTDDAPNKSLFEKPPLSLSLIDSFPHK